MIYRITADLDTKHKTKLIKSISRALKRIKKITNLSINLSNSKGYHLIIFTNQHYSDKEIYKIRKYIGDDLNRIRFDKRKTIGKQTLFDKKITIK